MTNKMSVKNKTLLFVTLSLIIFSLVLLGTIYINQKNKLQNLENQYYMSMKNSYQKILDKHEYFYRYRLLDLINTDGVKEAIYNKQRDKLLSLVKSRFEMLKKENSYLKVMHFHLPDGSTLLRVHKPKKYGDDIASIRAMAAAMHKYKKPLNGFEAGIHMMAYREFIPMFYNDKYIGSVELGSRPDQVLSEMEYFANIKGALFIKENKIIEYKGKNDFKIGKYRLQYNGLSDKELVKKLPKDYGFNKNIEITFNDRIYAVYPFDMLDYEGKVSAKAVFFNDITNMKNAFENTVKQLVVLLLVLMAVLIIVINLGFSKIIDTIENINNKLKATVDEMNKNKLFTDSILDNTAHAIIATDKNGLITLFNKKAEQMLGYKKEDIIGKKTPGSFHKKEQVEKRAKEFSKELGIELKPGFDVFTAKTDLGMDNDDEWIYIDSNNREFIVSLHITPLKDIDGNTNGYLGIAEDISHRKILEENLERQKEELEAIFHTTKDAIAILDMETNFLYFNDAYLTMTGFTKEELSDKSCASLSAPEDLPKIQTMLGEVMLNGYVENFEKTCIVKNSKRVIVNMSIALMPDKQRLLVSAKDITEAKQKEKQIAEYVKLVDKNIITSSTDLNGDITYVSEAFCEISGYSKEELLGKNHRVIRHPDMPDTIYKNLWDTITNDETWVGEIKNLKKDKDFYWVHASIFPIFDELGEKTGYTAIRQDITDKKLIEEISITDGLTGIYNRRHFNELFPKVINSSKRKDELVSFLIMDIDHFKQYNDTYGHQMGDDVLIKVAAAIKESLRRADDYCFRLGGEEFGVLFKADTKEKALQFANTIKQNIEDLHIEHSGNSASSYVTASMGLICKNANNIKDENEMYKLGDELLYKAKKSGRNRVCEN
jgi:diguanylate cyclase (GGDEF)-like protein/PAS domain S-box-containing protein